jgi:hypothetical protein
MPQNGLSGRTFLRYILKFRKLSEPSCGGAADTADKKIVTAGVCTPGF